MSAWNKRIRFGLATVLGAAYLYCAHQASISPAPGIATVIAALAPIFAGAVALAWRSRGRYLVIALCAALAVAVFSHLELLSQHIVWVYFAQSTATNLMLVYMFGHSLREPSQALCTRMARVVHPDMPPVIARYTYWLTAAWATYFALFSVVDMTLFLSGHVAAWSWLVNVLSFPLLGLLFAIEFFVRRFFIPLEHRSSILETIRSFKAMNQPRSVAHIKPSES